MNAAEHRNAEKRTFHWAWVILATCFLDLFINYSARLGYGVVLPEMIRDLGFTRTAAGSIFNAYLFSYITLTPLAGYLTDRIGARRVITFCLIVLGAGVFLMGKVGSFAEACLFYGIVGLGAAGLWTPVLTIVQQWFAPTHRGRALGVLSTGYGLGLAAMGLFFPWIVHEFNWRFAWYFLGTAAFFMAAVNGFLLRSRPDSIGCEPWGTSDARSAPSVVPPSPEGNFTAEVLRSRTFWLIGFSYFGIAYCLYGVTTFMVDYGRYEAGLSMEKASFLATVHGICQVIGVLTILPLSDYLGRKRTILLSNFFIMAAVAGILLTGTSSRTGLYVFIGMMAVFYGVTFPIYGACAGDYFPGKWMGTIIGSWTPFYGLGAICAHWAGGMIRDGSGSYTGAFVADMAMAGVAFLLFCMVRKR